MLRMPAVLSLSLALALVSSCKKEEEKKADPAGGSGATAEKGGVGQALGGGQPMQQVSGQAAADLDMIPVDSEVVAGLNFAQLQQSAIWQKSIMPRLAKGDFLAKLGEFKSTCGFDPMVAIKTVSVGLKNLADEHPEGVTVVHGLEKAKVLACLDQQKIKDELAKDKVEVTKDGDITLLVDKKDGNNLALKFLDDTTMVAVLGGKANKDAVQGIVSGKSALRTSPAFVDMYGKINAQDSLWALVNGNMKGVDKLATLLGLKPKALFGSINVTDGLTADLRMRVDTPDQAAQTAAGLSQQAAMAKQFVDNVAVTSDGADVKLTLAISNAKLMELQRQMGKGGGGGLGGMGGM